MPPAHPFIDVRHPDLPTATIAIVAERVTVGRLRDINDIVLEPDPHRYVSGRWHCVIEREGRAWRVLDEDSTNGTFLRRAGAIVEIRGAMTVVDGDVVCILASLEVGSTPTYWELTFRNPTQTVPVEGREGYARLEYDPVAARLFRVSRAHREELSEMRPQVHELLRYLFGRAQSDAPVLCTHDELIRAVWPESPCHTRQELNGLVSELRRCVEIDPGNPRFVQTVRGLGFRLDPRPPAS